MNADILNVHTVRELISMGYFDNKLETLPKPSKPKLPSVYATSTEVQDYLVKLKAFEYLELAWKKSQEEYRNENSRLHQLFKFLLEEEAGIVPEHQKNRLFSLAWEYRHSYGLAEVESYYSQLAELFLSC